MKFLIKLQPAFFGIICCQSCNNNQSSLVKKTVESKPVASVAGSQPAAINLVLTLTRVQPPKRDVDWRKLKKPKMDYRLFWINN
jgi:Ni,Fe-hydrogenase I small subunit